MFLVEHPVVRSLSALSVITALSGCTMFVMKKGQSLLGWNFEPFRGNVSPNLTFGVLLVTYVFFGLQVAKPQPLKCFHSFLSNILDFSITKDGTTEAQNLIRNVTDLSKDKELQNKLFKELVGDIQNLFCRILPIAVVDQCEREICYYSIAP